MQHTSLRGTTAHMRAVPLVVFLFLTVLLLALCMPSNQAHAVTAAEKQAEAEQALASLNAMQETLDRLSAEYGEALAAQAEAEESRDAAAARIVEIQAELERVQQILNKRARDTYRSGGVTFLEIVLDTATFEEFTTSLDMANRVAENDAQMVSQQKALRAEAEQQHAILEQQAEEAAQRAIEAEEAEIQAEATVAEMQATYDSLSAEAAQLLEEERKAREAEEAARAAAIVAASAAAAQSGGGSYDAAADSSAVVSSGAVYEGGSDTVSRAYACLGAPYVWGGVGPGGYDCSGLVSYCLTGSHSRLGTTYTFMNWPQVSNPQPGDIAVNWTHTGVYIGGGQMIHAADYGIGVIIGPVQSGMIIVRYGG